MEIDAALGAYLMAHTPPPDDVLAGLAAETRASAPDLQSSHYEGEVLAMLTRLMGARNVVSVGVFTGYTTLCMARAMAPGGTLLACEINSDWTGIAEKYWARAGVTDRIDLRIGPAADTLRALPAGETLDLAHIGADKVNHHLYYEELLARLRPGGVLVLGDALRGGLVLDPACLAEDVVAQRALNDLVTRDRRVDSIIFPAGDGATIVRKR